VKAKNDTRKHERHLFHKQATLWRGFICPTFGALPQEKDFFIFHKQTSKKPKKNLHQKSAERRKIANAALVTCIEVCINHSLACEKRECFRSFREDDCSKTLFGLSASFEPCILNCPQMSRSRINHYEMKEQNCFIVQFHLLTKVRDTVQDWRYHSPIGAALL